jgi:hypothetical protein
LITIAEAADANHQGVLLQAGRQLQRVCWRIA